MSGDFASSLRVRPETLSAGSAPERRMLRVEMPEVWDAVRVDAGSDATVRSVMDVAVAYLYPGASSSDMVAKVNGFEVLDEQMTVADASLSDGATLLVSFRRRRPVR